MTVVVIGIWTAGPDDVRPIGQATAARPPVLSPRHLLPVEYEPDSR